MVNAFMGLFRTSILTRSEQIDLDKPESSASSHSLTPSISERVEQQIWQTLRDDLTLKYHILNVHIIAVFVRILLCLGLTHEKLEHGFYSVVAQEVILIVTYLIYYKRQKNILIKSQIAILSSLITVILFVIDLWMICSIRSIEFER